MNKLRPLINDQKIQVDGHQRGARETNDWDLANHDIHIHKRTHTKLFGKPVDVDIKIPLNSDRPITYTIDKKASAIAQRRLHKEITKILTAEKEFQGFTDDLIEVLKNYSSKMSSKNKALIAAKRLAGHFGLLNEERQNAIVKYIDGKFDSIVVPYLSAEGEYFVQLDQQAITIGEQEERKIK
jgi:hypothetical protein